MICSTCGTDVEEYYKGKQCKLCVRKPHKAWIRNNRDKANAYSRKWRTNNPEKMRQCNQNWRARKRTIWLIHSRLKVKHHVRYLTDVYVRRQIRRSWGKTPHTISDQEINERRQQIIRWRETRVKKQEPEKGSRVFCPLVEKEILTDICHNVQKNYPETCREDCEQRRKNAYDKRVASRTRE